MTFRFVHEAPVRWSDLDAAGVVNNAVYLTLLEQCRFAYLKELGLLEGTGFPFLLGETSIRFLRPGREAASVAIAARVTRLGRKSLEMEYEVRHGEDLLATARATLVWVDASLKSREIPPQAREKIAEFEGIPAGG